GAHCLGKLTGKLQMLLSLDSPTNRDNALGLRQIDGLLRLFERRFGFLANAAGVDCNRSLDHRRGAGALLHRVSTEGADLKRHEMWRGSVDRNGRLKLALKHRPEVRERSAVGLDRDTVGHQRALELRRNRRREIAGLIR